MPAVGLSHWLAPVIVTLCWGLFVVVWLAGAIYNTRRAPAVRERSAFAGEWIIGIVAVVLLDRVVPVQIWRPITVDAWWLVLLGAAVLVVATGFTLWARVALGTMWTSSAVVKDNHVLRTGGPYGIIRHPIYTGLLGMLAGTALIEGLGRWVVFFAVGVLLVEVKIRSEERLLARTLDGAYDQYRQRVPRLIPALHRRP
ncbi:MAG TPA: isoprenylcysteine carboxylmethyltransferase family protein [Pseudonocardiaceae bacterium]